MKRTLSVLLGVTLLLSSAAAGGTAAQKPPRYKTYVACSHKPSAPAAVSCPQSKKKGAFFLSKDEDATYKICVKFPDRPDKLCANAQEAKKGVKTLNTITTAGPGKHKVTWYVAGQKVGGYTFMVTGS